MGKKRKILACLLSFFLVAAFFNDPALSRAESDTRGIAQVENENVKEENWNMEESDTDIPESGENEHGGTQTEEGGEEEGNEDQTVEEDMEDNGDDIPESEHNFDSEDNEFEEVQTEDGSEEQSNEDHTEEEKVEEEEEIEEELEVPERLLNIPMLNDIENPVDIGEYIEFYGQKLQYSSSIMEQDGDIFKYGYYTFSISWKTIDPTMTFNEGDYFTFEVPGEFGNLIFNLIAADGSSWGKVVIDADGYGTVTFNQEVTDLQDLKGLISLSGSYWETKANELVEWSFIFGEEYTYTGVSEGTNTSSNSVYKLNNSKSGWTNNDGTYVWCIYLNEKQEEWSGEITLTDTLGSGHKMTTYRGSLTETGGYYGKTNYHTANSLSDGEYFFEISNIDWNLMRKHYNEIVEYSKEQGSSVILDPNTGQSTKYAITDLLNQGKYSTYMISEMYYAAYKTGDNIPPEKSVGDYKYVNKHINGFDFVEITDGGFILVFPDGALMENGVQIIYYTEVSALIPQKVVQNTCEVSGTDISVKVNANVTVTGGATVTGTKGKLIIFKQDSDERENLSRVEFTLKKISGDSKYNKTQSTADNTGSTTFTLDVPFEGTYTLTENPATTPDGYKCAEPIKLELNNSGEIIKINNTPINGETKIPGVCRVDSDGLILIIYNEKDTMSGMISKTVTKVWDDNGNRNGLRTVGVTVVLLADGVQYGPEVELDESNGWKHTWSELPEKSGEEMIIYTVVETSMIPGYTTEYSRDTFTITNKLQQDPGLLEVIITGTKTLTGKSLTDDMFSFTVKDESGNIVSEGMNKDTGEIIFNVITFKDPGIYNYIISEQNDRQDGIVYDTKVYSVHIIIEEQDGMLQATINYPDGDVKFQNSAAPSLNKVAFTARKKLLGKSLEDGMFSFVVKDQAGNVVANAVNQGDGIIQFSEIEFTQSGTYVYFIEEINNNLYGISYDSTIYPATVVATQDGDSISLVVHYPENGIVFTNSYDEGDPEGGTGGGSGGNSGDGSGGNSGGSSGGNSGGGLDRGSSVSDIALFLHNFVNNQTPLAGLSSSDNEKAWTGMPKTDDDYKDSVAIILVGSVLCMAGLLLKRKYGAKGR